MDKEKELKVERKVIMLGILQWVFILPKEIQKQGISFFMKIPRKSTIQA